MDDKKINIEGLSMEKFLDQFNPGTIIEKSPAQKINIELDNELFVIGFNLMCEKNIKYDLEDLKFNTLVCIHQRHMIECLMMIAGAIYCVLNIHGIDDMAFINAEIFNIKDSINDIVLFTLIKDTAHIVEQDVVDLIHENKGIPANLNNDALSRLEDIIKYIWFLPYSEIDKLKEKIKKELGDSNE